MSNSPATPTPVVTVVIPVYNTERFVHETLKSALSQTYENLEIIIVIDGSTDRSAEICKSFSDSRIRIFEQENKGLAASRNMGIKEASGEFIGFLDSDDLWEPNKVMSHVDLFLKDARLGAIFSHSKLIDEHSRELGVFQKEGHNPLSFRDFYVQNVVGNGSNMILRKSVFTGQPSTVNGYPAMNEFLPELRHAEDFELWSRIAVKTRWRISCIPEPLVRYRINSQGLSANMAMQRKYHFFALALIANYAPEEAEKLRWDAVAHAYWHQSRVAAHQYKARIGLKAAMHATWYEWRSISTNHVMVLFANLAAAILPKRTYYGLLRFGERFWGKLQKHSLQMANLRDSESNSKQRSIRKKARVIKPATYIRRNALPNMFFLCHRHRFMFIGIAKNASTSLKQIAMLEEQDVREHRKTNSPHRYWGFKPSRGRTIELTNQSELSEYPNYIKFAVYRDPVSRFLSAYHNRLIYFDREHEFYFRHRLSGMGLEQFLQVAENALKISNREHIDEHIRPQAWYYDASDVDVIVPIERLDTFLLDSFGIRLGTKVNKTVLPKIEAADGQIRRIKHMYECDYAIKPNWPQC